MPLSTGLTFSLSFPPLLSLATLLSHFASLWPLDVDVDIDVDADVDVDVDVDVDDDNDVDVDLITPETKTKDHADNFHILSRRETHYVNKKFISFCPSTVVPLRSFMHPLVSTGLRISNQSSLH